MREGSNFLVGRLSKAAFKCKNKADQACSISGQISKYGPSCSHCLTLILPFLECRTQEMSSVRSSRGALGWGTSPDPTGAMVMVVEPAMVAAATAAAGAMVVVGMVTPPMVGIIAGVTTVVPIMPAAAKGATNCSLEICLSRYWRSRSASAFLSRPIDARIFLR